MTKQFKYLLASRRGRGVRKLGRHRLQAFCIAGNDFDPNLIAFEKFRK